MPSGAKKRKAAKKKKEQEANNSSSANNSNSKSKGNDDTKSQDERESDGGEAGSPASQGHHNHQHPFKEGNEESDQRDPSPVRSFDSQNKFTDEVRSFDSQNKSMDEVGRELEATQKLVVEDDGASKIERELRSEKYSGSQNISIEHVEFVKESLEASSSCSSSDNESQVAKKTSKKAAYISHNGENRPAEFFPEEVIQGTEKASFEGANNSVVETAPVGLSVKSEEVIYVTQGDLVESPVVSDGSRLNESEESKRNEEKVIPLSENVEASSTVVDIEANESEGNILPTSVPPAETSNGAKSTRDSKIPDSSENQPLIPSAPRVEQRTSWMSCCGLLDLLTGSSR